MSGIVCHINQVLDVSLKKESQDAEPQYLMVNNINNNIVMAKPIRNTPILFGEDARRFREEISNLPPAEERRKERARINESVKRLRERIAALNE